MEITFDPRKRADTLKHRGLDFACAAQVFADFHFTVEDDRRDYGELRSKRWAGSTGRLSCWSGRRAARPGG